MTSDMRLKTTRFRDLSEVMAPELEAKNNQRRTGGLSSIGDPSNFTFFQVGGV